MCFERTSSISNFDLSSNMYGSRSACAACRFMSICDYLRYVDSDVFMQFMC